MVRVLLSVLNKETMKQDLQGIHVYMWFRTLKLISSWVSSMRPSDLQLHCDFKFFSVHLSQQTRSIHMPLCSLIYLHGHCTYIAKVCTILVRAELASFPGVTNMPGIQCLHHFGNFYHYNNHTLGV